VDQIPLIDQNTPPEAEPRLRRSTSKGIAPGDIVEVDKKGRRFHAVVSKLDQQDSGRFELEVRPLERGITFRTASVREVIGVWRKSR
jgi:ASC-1-like (ASCH) protein